MQDLSRLNSGDLVKFYARFSGKDANDATRLTFACDTYKVIVDVSSFESCICDFGEWYRIMGEVVIHDESNLDASLTIKALLVPKLVDGFDVDQYDKVLTVKRGFNIDNLIAYAYKHRY